MNIPNKLSMLRILLVPVILLFMLPIRLFGFVPENWNAFVLDSGTIIAGFLFIIAAITDLIDGSIARKQGIVTNMGIFLDSLADKMLVISVLIAFVNLGRINAIFVIIIVVREFMVTGIRMIASQGGVVMSAEMIGKIKAALQMVALAMLLQEPLLLSILGFFFVNLSPYMAKQSVVYFNNTLFLTAVLMTVISGMHYMIANFKHLKNDGRSSNKT